MKTEKTSPKKCKFDALISKILRIDWVLMLLKKD